MIDPQSGKPAAATESSDERDQPKLHEAMRTILLTHKDRILSFEAISRENRRRDLYRRPADGKYPNAIQIRARAAKYHKLFERIGGGEIKYIGPAAPVILPAKPE
jgi:hypothetical protein